MPQLIDYIDAIARKKQRGVLILQFHPENMAEALFEYDHNKDKLRKKVLLWLKNNKIPWQECGPIASEHGFDGYLGNVYIDVPYDENDPQYQLVRDYLEYPDGSMRFETVQFLFLSLELAMKNAHHESQVSWNG